jgi:hypothetical protein
MELSRHAAVRKQQRGFQAGDFELIMSFGTCIRKPGNVIEYRMDHKNEKHLVQAIDRIKGKSVLVSDDEKTVITVYNRSKGSSQLFSCKRSVFTR